MLHAVLACEAEVDGGHLATCLLTVELVVFHFFDDLGFSMADVLNMANNHSCEELRAIVIVFLWDRNLVNQEGEVLYSHLPVSEICDGQLLIELEPKDSQNKDEDY